MYIYYHHSLQITSKTRPSDNPHSLHAVFSRTSSDDTTEEPARPSIDAVLHRLPRTITDFNNILYQGRQNETVPEDVVILAVEPTALALRILWSLDSYSVTFFHLHFETTSQSQHDDFINFNIAAAEAFFV